MASKIFHPNSCLRCALCVLLIALCAVGQSVSAQSAQSKQQAKRVIIISLDGLDARYLNRRDEYGLRIPTLRRLMAGGATARGVTSVYPSVTYPAHTTIVTGALPWRHGILGNEIFESPDDKQTGELHWFARDIKADTLWDAASRAGLKTAMVSWPASAGAGDYSFPEILSIGGGLQATLQLVKANDRPDGLVEELERRDPQLYSKASADETDDLRTRFAEYMITEKHPDLLLVHLFDLDHFEHLYGPFTPESFAMLEKLDGYVARILTAAERAGTMNETAIFIVSDHGFKPIGKQVNPSVLLAQAGLLMTREVKDVQGSYRMEIVDWRAVPFVTSGSCSIILRDPKDAETLRKVRAIFKPLAGKKGSGIFRVIEADEVRRLGANPRAALMLDAEDGYTFGRNVTGDFITVSDRLGQHGYLPTRPDYKASLIAYGAGIGRRGSLGEVRMIDIAPTIARLLKLSLRDAEGRALKLR
jgi:predicted AlkP superfamily pyrophosphatase or phosphodiesterase